MELRCNSRSTRSSRRTINATQDIVTPPISTPTPTKRKKVDICIHFSKKCTSQCRCRYNSKSQNNISKINKLIEEQCTLFKNQMKKNDHQFRYIKLAHEIGTDLAKSTLLLPYNNTSYYLYPISPHPDTSDVLCSHCFKCTLGIEHARLWSKALSPYRTLDSIPSITIEKEGKKTNILYDVIMFLHKQVKDNNIAVVVSEDKLNQYEQTIVLRLPYITHKGNIYYDSNAIVNGELQPLQDGMALNYRSVVFAVRKSEMDMFMRDNGMKQQYKYEDCEPWDDDIFIILSAVSTQEDDSTAFHPTHGDFSLFTHHKNSAIATKQASKSKVKGSNHHDCRGWYFAEGTHALFNSLSLGKYASINQHHVESYEFFQSRLRCVESLLLSAITSLNTEFGFEIVRAASYSTVQNRDYMQKLNILTQVLGGRQVDIDAVASNTALFPSYVVSVNAGTGLFHTEKDQGYTLIISTYQSCVNHPSFCFKVNPKVTLPVPLTNGKNVLFNARLLTHRQDNCGCNNIKLGQFWSVGCYANEQLNNHTFTVMRDGMSSVLSNFSAFL